MKGVLTPLKPYAFMECTEDALTSTPRNYLHTPV